MKTRILSAAFGFTLWGYLSLSAQAVPHPASSADDFVDRIGVATHWGYPDTPYGYAYDTVKQLLADSGIRHVRDGFHPRERELWERFGIKTTMIVGPQQPLEKTLQTLRDNHDLIAMVEGPNEVDIFTTSANYKGQGFPEGPRQFQDELYAAIKTDTLLKDLEVIAPSVARNDANLKLAPMNSFDYLVMHPYAGGQLPSSSLEGNVINNMLNATRILGAGANVKPIVVTESGYHTAVGANQVIAGVQPGVSEAVQAKYLPRHFAEYFNAGIRRTITYEFINEFKDEATNAEASFGIVRRDLTPKPAYHAMKNLIALLGEAKWDAAQKKWQTPAVHLKALDFDLNAPPTVHHTLLQKSDGTFYLLLWNEVSSYDTDAKKEIVNAPVPVTIKFVTPVKSAVISHVGKNVAPSEISLSNQDRAQQLKLEIPDEVIVLEIAPRSRRYAVGPALIPAKLTAETGANRVTLNWRKPGNTRGYFVWRLGRYLGFTKTETFTDEKLQPNTGYTYEISALDGAGNVGPAARIVAKTQNQMPDLVVTEISWTPANPKAGDEVTFGVTIKNIGNGPSPAGTIHGIAFFVNGQFISWSDTYNQWLAPGASVTLTSNDGPQNKKTWLAIAGNSTVRAVVDDVNRINESDENNNTKETALTIAP